MRAGPCRLWFVSHCQSFIHVVSSADPLGLKAIFERTLQSCDSLAPPCQKCVTAHQNHTESISAKNNTSFFQSSFQQEFLSMSSEFTFGDNSDKWSFFQCF